MTKAIEDMKVPVMALPTDLPADASAAQKRQWEKRIDKISKDHEDSLFGYLGTSV